MYRALAELTVVVHFGFLVFLAVGGLIALRWRRLLWFHAAAAVWGIGIVTIGQPCPLTLVERWFREQGGATVNRTGFIDTYVRGVIFPGEAMGWMRVAVALVVLGSWVALWTRRPDVGDPVTPSARPVLRRASSDVA